MKPSTTSKTTTRRKTPAKTGHIRPLNKRVDVVLGRGKGCTCSKGNQRYLCLIEKYATEYVQAKSRKEQNDVKLNIIREVREYEGHFLQPVEGSSESGWEEAPLETVLNKIAQVCCVCVSVCVRCRYPEKKPAHATCVQCTLLFPISHTCSHFAITFEKAR